MATRDIYLKIENIAEYSPVFPEDHPPPPRQYGRDCMYNPGHENGLIPQSEVNARTLTALVYREYLDPGYTIPKPDRLVVADVNEPPFHRRVPGTVIYCHPGDRLQIHVLNWDFEPHSLHVHGVAYGVDSDGSWPFGVAATDGRRSDEICPGQTWTYIFDVTEAMIGAWPFHDHHRHITENVNRGLFGGIVVLHRENRPPFALKLPPRIQELLEHIRKHPIPIPGPGPHPGPLPGPHPRPSPRPGPGPDPVPIHHGRAFERGRAIGHRAGVSHGHGGGVTGSEFPIDRRIWMEIEFLKEWVQLDHIHPRPVRPRSVHVPLFLHLMAGADAPSAFDSPDLSPGDVFETILGNEGSYGYHCRFHPNMQGRVEVVAGAPALAAITIRDTPMMLFDASIVTVGPGATVRWTHSGVATHSVTEDGGGLSTWCLNGRSFVGNTPTIEVTAGQNIRWYVFNLDLGMMWHNFHPHALRWTFAGETIDVRSIGPAESFVVNTIAPPPLLLPPDIAAAQEPEVRPVGAQPYQLRADFPVHCHVEMHMMQGFVALVRSRQTVWLTPQQATDLAAERGLPLDPGGNGCPVIDHDRCENLGCGMWEEMPGNPEVAMMHAALVPQTAKVLYWGYTRADQSRLWDHVTRVYSLPANQPADVAPIPGDVNTSNMWSAEHAFTDMPEGELLVHGGFSPNQSYIFNPATLSWSRTGATAHDRFYSTTLTLADGRILTLFGSSSTSIEVYDPATGIWSAPIALPVTFLYQFYPWTYLLPGGDLFIAGPTGVSRRFAWNAPVDDPARRWNTIAGNRSTGGEKGTSVLLPLRPPNYEPHVLIAGGNTPSVQQTAEIIDLSTATPAWASLPNLNVARPEQFTAVLLPDGQVLIAGGDFSATDGGPAEVFDPQNAADGWRLCARMTYKRGYHSSNILLPDGSVLMGGDPAGAGQPTPHERYVPWYFGRPRPIITTAPSRITYGSSFTVQSPQAGMIAEVILIRPGAVTHGFNQSQRFVGCAVTGIAGNNVNATAPPDGTVAPPGFYLLFIVDGSRVPSEGRWIRVGM